MAENTSNSGVPFLGPVLDLLTAILSNAGQLDDLARAVDKVEQNTWTNALNVAEWSYGLFGGVLGAIGDLIKGLAKLLAGLFGQIIWGFLKKLLRHILDWIANLRHWIRVHIAVWQQIQKNLDQARSQYFRKALDVLQRIRKILVPFRLLHLKFASELDARLVGVESDLGRAWAKLIVHNNQVLGVLNDIIDPRNLLRPGHMLGSVGLMVGAIHGAVGALDVRSLLCLSPATAATPLVAPWSTTQALVLNDIQHNTGDYAVYAAQRDDTLRQYAQDLGVSSLV